MKSIRISNQTYLHLYLHKVEFTLDEAFSQSDDPYYKRIDFSESAKLLIDGMEDEWCVPLLEAIKKECEVRIQEAQEIKDNLIKNKTNA